MNRKVKVGLSAIASVVFAASPLVAQIWKGTSTNDWSDPSNWIGPVPGAVSGTTNGDTATFNQSAANSPTTIDVGRNLQSIVFDTASVSPTTIGTTIGNSLLLTAGGSVSSTSTVTNLESINAPLELEGDYAFTSGASGSTAPLNFGGGITPGPTGGAVALTLGGTNSGLNTISGAIADNGSNTIGVAMNGPGLWILGGANTYTGGNSISAGTLRLANGSALGSGPLFMSGGTLDVNGFDASVAGLAGSGTIDNVSAAGTTKLALNGAATTTFSGNLQNTTGTISLTESGSGTQVLTGTNTYSGTTTINAGIMQFGGVASIGGSGASVTVNSAGAIAFTPGLTNAAFLSRLNGSSTGTLALTGADAAANIDFTSATLSALSNLSVGAVGPVTYSGVLTPASGQYRLGGGGGTLTYSPQITVGQVQIGTAGAGGATGTVIFPNPTNTYSGATSIGSGTTLPGVTLLANSSDPMALGSNTGSGPVTVNNTGTLGGNGFIGGIASVSAGGSLYPSANGAASKLTFRSDLSLASGGVNLHYLLNDPTTVGPAGGNDLIGVGGNFTINPNVSLDVTYGNAFAYGTYPLFQFPSGSLIDNSTNFSNWTVANAPPGTTPSFAKTATSVNVVLSAPPVPLAPGDPVYTPVGPGPGGSFPPAAPGAPKPSMHLVGYNENCLNTTPFAQKQLNIVLKGRWDQPGALQENYPTFGPGTTVTPSYDPLTDSTTLQFYNPNPGAIVVPNTAPHNVGHVGYSLLGGPGGGEGASPLTVRKYWSYNNGGTNVEFPLPAPTFALSNLNGGLAQGPNTKFLLLYSTVELSGGGVAGEWSELQVPVGQFVTADILNNDKQDGPMFAFKVGFFLSDTQIPLDDLNNTYEPPTGSPNSPFTPLPGIPDGTPIAPGGMASATIFIPGLNTPEPSSAVLLVLGAVGLLGSRARAKPKSL